MKLRIWCKTMLSVYGYLPKITESIDKVVSTYSLAQYKNNVDFFLQAQKVIDLTQRKIGLINLKILVENILNDIDSSEVRVLMLRYVDKISTDNIALCLKCSKRTVFRRISSGISKMQTLLIEKKFSSKKLFDLYGREGWIMSTFDHIMIKEQNMSENSTYNNDICEKDFFKYALNVLSKGKKQNNFYY